MSISGRSNTVWSFEEVQMLLKHLKEAKYQAEAFERTHRELPHRTINAVSAKYYWLINKFPDIKLHDIKPEDLKIFRRRLAEEQGEEIPEETTKEVSTGEEKSSLEFDAPKVSLPLNLDVIEYLLEQLTPEDRQMLFSKFIK